MSQRLSATEAARRFSELLNRVRFRGETFDIVRNGEVVARVTSPLMERGATAADLIAAVSAAGHADAGFADELERIQADQPALPDDPWGT